MSRSRPTAVPAADLAAVAKGGADDAGGLDPGLLDDFLPIVVDAVAAGRRLGSANSRRFNRVGKAAAERGVALRALLDLYLSAAWRLWDHLPEVIGAAQDPDGVVRAGRAVLRATDDVVAALTEGYQLARRELIRAEAQARQEFVDDLLNSGRSVAGLIERAAGFGLTLAGSHAVAVLRAGAATVGLNALSGSVERALRGSKADADALVATKDGRLLVVFAAPDRQAVTEVVERLVRVLPDRTAGRGWQLGVGRPRPGAAGIRESFDEALQTLELGQRLAAGSAMRGAGPAVLDAADLLVYRVLLRDEAAIRDLMDDVLGPLQRARGGAQPLLDTLFAYFESGGNSSATARAMHLSVRAVSYRLDRVRELSGHHPDDPEQWFALQVAVLGARLLGWPATQH
jgi:sugar diacid utilization regulator